jgi:hypothetical protein
VSFLATILDQRQQVRQALLAETQQLTEVGTQQTLHALEQLAAQIGGSIPDALHAKVLLGRLINQQAQLLAFNDGFALFVFISLCGVILAFFFRRSQPPVS